MNNKSNRNEEKKGVNLVVLAGGGFPRPGASTNRILAYAKGVISNGGMASVLCVRPSGFKRLGDRPIAVSGIFNGVSYVCAPGVKMCPKSFLRRCFLEVKGLVRSIRIIKELNHSRKIDAILFYYIKAHNEVPLIFLARYLRIPVIAEKCEYPFLGRSTYWCKLRTRLHEIFVDRLFDGMIMATNFLETYYKTVIGESIRSIVVPGLVEPERFEKVVSSGDLGEYVAYCGNLSGNKDGVPTLIEAFSILAEKYSELKLYIIGAGNDEEVLSKLRAQAQKLHVANRVIFTGRIDREEIPRYLCNASVLALARPASLQSDGGFPTKLGEYLCTGKPVVVTDVSDLKEYLQDGVSAFIAPPNSARAFADKLDYVLANPDLARKVGLRGKDVAYTALSYKVHGRRIADFVRKLKG